MFELTQWKQTRFYQGIKEEVRQEVKEEVREEIKEEVRGETKIKTIPLLLREGLTVEQISRVLELDIEIVKQIIKQQSSQQTLDKKNHE